MNYFYLQMNIVSQMNIYLLPNNYHLVIKYTIKIMPINQSFLSEADKSSLKLLLKKWLTPDNVSFIAKKHGLANKGYVYHVINFRRKNVQIFNEALEIALKNKKEHQETIQKLENESIITN